MAEGCFRAHVIKTPSKSKCVFSQHSGLEGSIKRLQENAHALLRNSHTIMNHVIKFLLFILHTCSDLAI